MKTAYALLMLVCSSCYGVEQSDWFGHYAVSMESAQGTLDIAPSQRKCTAAPKGCGLDIRYSDGSGKPVKVAVLEFEPTQNQAVLYIGLSDGPRKVAVHLIDHPSRYIVGTASGKSSEGFVAVQQTDAKPACPISVKKRILNTGQIELTQPDGTIVLKSLGGTKTVFPNGKTSSIAYENVIPLSPAGSPFSPNEDQWLQGHLQALLDLIGALTPDDPNGKSNYLQSENAQDDIYKKIVLRTSFISIALQGQ